MSLGERISFSQLLAKGSPVEIPIIQRDYAQGREGAAEVRDQFLLTIFNTLSTDPSELNGPLDLDFVYGSMEGDAKTRFSPLDGQQRLTTLFLLHWYLANLDNDFDHFCSIAADGNAARFTYQTRTSSAEFFNSLVNESIDLRDLLPGNTANALSRTIRNSQWFFLSWQLDPTIQSSLVMLDALHARFFETIGFYQRLVNHERPYVTFQFLNLREFGLSDDLYIKMNARGKPLTPFENFKAKLEQHIDKVLPGETREIDGRTVSLKEYFSFQMDMQWADLFWGYRDRKINLFDQQIMNFIKMLSGLYYPVERDNWRSGLNELRNPAANFTFIQYENLGCLNEMLIRDMVCILDVISEYLVDEGSVLESVDYFDEISVFKKALQPINPQARTGLTYEESVQFFAYCSFIVTYVDSINILAFNEWMRVIRNLTANTPYDNVDNFRDSIVSIHAMVSHADHILDYLAEDDAESIKGFSRQQVREERLKALLIARNHEWKQCLFLAESHGYFKGQIEFLLDFSGVLEYFNENKSCGWDDQEDEQYRIRFINYFEKSACIFNDAGLNCFPNFIWERALLSIGDYLICSNRNHSFLDNISRDTSWKRLLRGDFRISGYSPNASRGYVKILFDMLDISNVEESIVDVIANAEIEERWRRLLVDCPEAFRYCERSFIRRDGTDDVVYLLKKSQTNGAHVELNTFHFFHSFISRLTAQELFPFKSAHIHETYSSTEPPSVYLSGMKYDDVILSIGINYYGENRYNILISCNFSIDFPDEIIQHMIGFVDDRFMITVGESRVVMSIKHDDLLDGFACFLRHMTDIARNTL